MARHFPPMVSDQISVEEQCRKVLEEFREARAAFAANDMGHFIHEVWDAIHAAETLMDVLEREWPGFAWQVRQLVREKNRQRGRYYQQCGACR